MAWNKSSTSLASSGLVRSRPRTLRTPWSGRDGRCGVRRAVRESSPRDCRGGCSVGCGRRDALPPPELAGDPTSAPSPRGAPTGTAPRPLCACIAPSSKPNTVARTALANLTGMQLPTWRKAAVRGPCTGSSGWKSWMVSASHSCRRTGSGPNCDPDWLGSCLPGGEILGSPQIVVQGRSKTHEGRSPGTHFHPAESWPNWGAGAGSSASYSLRFPQRPSAQDPGWRRG